MPSIVYSHHRHLMMYITQLQSWYSFPLQNYFTFRNIGCRVLNECKIRRLDAVKPNNVTT